MKFKFLDDSLKLIACKLTILLETSFTDDEEVNFISLAYKEFLPLHYIEGDYF